MSRNSDDGRGIFIVIVLAIFYGLYKLYLALKGVADPLGITVSALTFAIAGLTADFILVGWCVLGNGNKARVLPSLLPVTYFFSCPAQTCWATRPSGAVDALAYVQSSDDAPDVAFWGGFPFQCLVFIALCVVAYFLMKKFDEHYRW